MKKEGMLPPRDGEHADRIKGALIGVNFQGVQYFLSIPEATRLISEMSIQLNIIMKGLDV